MYRRYSCISKIINPIKIRARRKREEKKDKHGNNRVYPKDYLLVFAVALATGCSARASISADSDADAV